MNENQTAYIEGLLSNLERQRQALAYDRARIAAAIAAADHAATERACAAVCVLCRHGNIWLPALEDEKSGFWLHQHSNPNSHQGPMVCDATSIREAAAKAKAQP